MMIHPDWGHGFSMERGTTGALLLHGYAGSPREFRPLGQLLADRGVTVSCPLLPGHGTTEEEANKVTWPDWVAAVDSAFVALQARCSQIFAIGSSMGAHLAFYLAARCPVAGVAAFGAFLKPADWRSPLLHLVKYFVPVGPDINFQFKDPTSMDRFAGYSKTPYWGASEFMKLCRRVQDDLPLVHCPVLLVHGRDDTVADFAQMDAVAARLGTRDVQKLALDNSYHMVLIDQDREIVNQQTCAFVMRLATPSPPG